MILCLKYDDIRKHEGNVYTITLHGNQIENDSQNFRKNQFEQKSVKLYKTSLNN